MAVLDKTSSWYSLRGKVGSLLVSSNAQSSFVRGLRPPNPKRSPLQSSERAIFTGIMGRWKQLTDGEQADWRAAAALPEYERYDWYGQVYNMSGSNLFCAINRITFGAFGTYQLTVPTDPAPAVTPASSFVWTNVLTTTMGIVSDPAGWPADVAALRVTMLARYLSTQAVATTTPKLIHYKLSSEPAGVDLTFAIQEAFGMMSQQLRAFFQVTAVSVEGRLGPTLSYDVVVA